MKATKIHLLKTISWRIIGTIDTLVFAWIFSNDLSLSIGISAVTFFTKMIWYYLHEKAWFNSSLNNPNRVHLYKTFTWRFIGTIDTIIFSWIILGDPVSSLKIGIAETITKMILYYFHEKLWFNFTKKNFL